jgi:hypothetical protein
MTIPKWELIVQCSAMMIAGLALEAVNTQGDKPDYCKSDCRKKDRRDNPSGLCFDLLG